MIKTKTKLPVIEDWEDFEMFEGDAT